MRIQTPKETRREMAQQISERLGIPARYSGAPSFAYVIGEIAVERDGSLVSGNTDLLESLKPLLARKGYIRQTAQASRMTVQEPVTGATVAVAYQPDQHAVQLSVPYRENGWHSDGHDSGRAGRTAPRGAAR